jgi:hypothetical protein
METVYRREVQYPRIAREMHRSMRSRSRTEEQGEARMHGVVVRVTIKDAEVAEQALREQVVPRASESPGFVTGYWLRKDSSGLSFAIFESEDAAREPPARTSNHRTPTR